MVGEHSTLNDEPSIPDLVVASTVLVYSPETEKVSRGFLSHIV